MVSGSTARGTRANGFRWLAGLGLLLCLGAGADEAAPPAMVGLCAVCHGESGPSPFIGVPTIHGLPEGVIAAALYDFREGYRPCRVSACSRDGRCPDMSMCDIVGPMDDQQVDGLAEWYADQPFAAHQDSFDPALAAIGRELHMRECEVCHTQLGSDPLDDAGMLRGQRKVYLRTALEDFHQGRRVIDIPAMEEPIRNFSPAELDALAEFYAGPAVAPLPAR